MKGRGRCGMILTMVRPAKNKIGLIIFMVIFAIAAGCARKAPDDDNVLAQVSNRFITLGDFKKKIARLPAYYQNVVEKNKKRYLDEVIMEALMYEEALRKGLEKDKEVKEVVNEARKKILIAKLVKNEVEDNVKVTEDELKSFYESHKDEFKSPPMWRASHILVSDEQEAKEILSELAKGANFEELAKARSMDATASRGGDVGYFRAGQLVPEFEKACLDLKVGEMSGIVHTQFGYHIIKLTDRNEEGVESYEKAKRKIESDLKKKKRSELFDKLVADLKEKYGVKIKEDVFKTLDKKS